MKFIKKLFILLLFMALTTVTLATGNIVFAEGRMKDGITFPNASEVYETMESLKVMPKTFEAYIHIPTSQTQRAGIIFGNYGPDNTTACYSFEVYSDGYPKLYYDVDNIGSKNPNPVNINFKEVDVRSEGFVHLVIVHDTANKKAHCYLNGELKQSVDVDEPTDYNGYNFVPSKTARVGGDYRGGNGQYFKGNIKALEFYSDVRSSEEIKADYDRVLSQNPNDKDLICAYNFTQSDDKYLRDLSGNGYTLDYSGDDNLDIDAIKFESDARYVTKENYEVFPHTFEAEVLISKKYSDRVGVILGNYGNGASISFEINTSGRPRLFYMDSTGKEQSIIFQADVRTGTWAHLVITHDLENKKVYCYIDSKLVGESNLCVEYNDNIINSPLVLGGDLRSGNEQYFKGFIRSVAVFSSVRSQEEIISDYQNGVDLNDSNLMVCYKMDKSNEGKDIKNLASDKYDLNHETTWFSEKDEEVMDYAYSFAVIGDTQIMARRYPDDFGKIYDWIIDNKESKKIQYVFGLGDITDANTPQEWALAGREISKLNGIVPYSLVRGNHDSSNNFNKIFFNNEYCSQFDGFYDEAQIDSVYDAFTVGKTDYLLITLDYGASDEELEWAGSIIEQYPNHRVIITTHCYMFRDKTTLGPNDVCPPADSNDANYSPDKIYNNGDEMWEKFISQYGNIFLVLSGHDPCENIVTLQSEGYHGNTVTQILIDPQGMDASIGATGMVCMLYFNEDGTEMEVEFYSTVKNQFFKESNQYKVDISKTGTSAHNYNMQYNEKEHFGTCDCGATIKEEHKWDNGTLLDGKIEYKCMECDATHVEIIEDENPGNNDSSGCNGSIVTSIALINILMFGIIVSKKKKK